MAKKSQLKLYKKTIGFNFYRPKGAITSLNSITSELAKVQYITAKVGKLEYRAKLFLQNFEKRCKIAIFAGTLGKPA